MLRSTGTAGAACQASEPASRRGSRAYSRMPPATMVSGVPHHVDGRMLEIASRARGSVINSDRMWHYTEGLRNFDPIWPDHGIRILPGPSSFWCDAGHQ